MQLQWDYVGTCCLHDTCDETTFHLDCIRIASELPVLPPKCPQIDRRFVCWSQPWFRFGRAAFLIRDRDEVHDLWIITWLALCHDLFDRILAIGTLPMRWSHLHGQVWTLWFTAEDFRREP